ncbi:MAG: hypothetical protein V3W41_11085 [Planctomycetota bacterium]
MILRTFELARRSLRGVAAAILLISAMLSSSLAQDLVLSASHQIDVRPEALAFSRDGTTLRVETGGQQLRFALRDGLRSLGGDGSVKSEIAYDDSCVALPDGKFADLDEETATLRIASFLEGKIQREEKFKIDGRPRLMAKTADGRLLFLGDVENHRLVVFDVWNRRVRQTVDLPGVPGGLAVGRDDIDLIVTLPEMDKVIVLNTASREIVYEIEEAKGARPTPTVVMPGARKVVFANCGTDAVAVLDLDSRRVSYRLVVGDGPTSLARRPQSHEIWVALPKSQSLARLSILTVTRMSSDSATRRPTQVGVLGMIHGSHRTSKLWSLGQVADTVRRFKPDVLLVEIPPDRWERAKRDFEERGVIEERRTRVFPEYVDCLFHLAAELKIPIEPCAGWSTEMNDLRRRRMRAFGSEERFEEANDSYRRESKAAREERDPKTVQDDPHFVNSAAYDTQTKRELEPYDRHLNEWIGPGGWTNINRAHYTLVDRALTRHAGKRCLLTFGAGHKYWFLEQLRERFATEIIDLKPFLPKPGELAKPEDRFPFLSERCRAEVVDLHRFFDRWFRAELENSPEELARFSKAMGPDFEMVHGDGRTTARDKIIEVISGMHGSRRDPRGTIEIRKVRVRILEPQLRLVTYEEWVRRGEEWKGISASAVMRADPRAPGGVHWVHLHESFLTGKRK